jgi:hypothetical protein
MRWPSRTVGKGSAMQDSLIPNTVFLIPLLQDIAALGGPVTLEVIDASDKEITVTTFDGISVPVRGVKDTTYRVTVAIRGEPAHFEASTTHHLSPFHEAWLCHALRRDLVRRECKVTTKAESKEGVEHYTLGIDHTPPPARPMSESYLTAEAWLMHAQQGRRYDNRQKLFSATEAEILRKREERRREEELRRKLEQEEDTRVLS